MLSRYCPPLLPACQHCHWCRTSRSPRWFGSGPPWSGRRPGRQGSCPSGGPGGCRSECSSCGSGCIYGGVPGCGDACAASGAQTGWIWLGRACTGKASLQSGAAGGFWDCWCCWTACDKPNVGGGRETANEWEAILWFKSQTPRRRRQDEAAAFYIFTLSHKGKKIPTFFI